MTSAAINLGPPVAGSPQENAATGRGDGGRASNGAATGQRRVDDDEAQVEIMNNHGHDLRRTSLLQGDEMMQEEAAKFVLLAEFDIDQGATLTHQYPFPTGTDEHTLAELMLPDGAHLRSEDWTIFYLNQTRKNAVAPPIVSESLSPSADKTFDRVNDTEQGSAATATTGKPIAQDKHHDDRQGLGELLFVLNCVRMKEDKSVRRGATVKALAVCTTKPCIQIYKPLLLLALEEYYHSPSPHVLAKLFDSLNSISLNGCPNLTRAERIILRNSDRKDLFAEKFGITWEDRDGQVNEQADMDWLPPSTQSPSNESGPSNPSGNTKWSFKDTLKGIGIADGGHRRLRKTSRTSLRADSFDASSNNNNGTASVSSQPSASGQSQHRGLGIGRPGEPFTGGVTGDVEMRKRPRDTHFFDTSAEYIGLNIPIRIPLSIFPDEVGDVSSVPSFTIIVSATCAYLK